ncbi:radical SAM/SPASM domain-containing protein [Aureivirga marina]|uniref:radical SAM/SPASM domain-containing protein n=1 Tax=Aureivirga marina TaxID=1182451 RepID=UPI0018C9A542|nr:radical SAM protein [Aureivirga marina]
MKYSQFNSIIPFQEKYALYNSFENKVIFLENDLKEILNAGVEEGIENLQEIHPTFYDYLVENKFVIDTSIDEVAKVKALSVKTDENLERFNLTINPTMNCNFKCWYCYEDHIKSSRLGSSMVEKINKFITRTLQEEELKYFSLSFFGGEPLLYFKRNVIPIMTHLKYEGIKYDKIYSISFTTNGYLIDDDFINYFKEQEITCSLQITLDGYREEHDKVRFVNKTKGSYDEIIQNIKKLLVNEFHIRLRINYTDKNLEDTYKIVDDLSDLDPEIVKKYLLIDFHRVWQNEQVDNLDITLNRNMDIMRKKGFVARGSFSANNVVDSCYADKRNSAVINYNGDLFKCTARDFKSKDRAGFINEEGVLIWNDNYMETRMTSKFKNKPCLDCRLLAICNGGCTQHAMENLDSEYGYCVYSFDDAQKDKVIKAKIDEIIQTV